MVVGTGFVVSCSPVNLTTWGSNLKGAVVLKEKTFSTLNRRYTYHLFCTPRYTYLLRYLSRADQTERYVKLYVHLHDLKIQFGNNLIFS